MPSTARPRISIYEDLDPDALPEGPAAWCCGDAHLENFGTFKGDNGLTYFDVNDFDQAALLPLTWELARFATSICVAGAAQELCEDERLARVRAFLAAYASTLADGRALWIERATATGAVRKLMHRLRNRTQSEFLTDRIERLSNLIRLHIDDKHTLHISTKQRRELFRLIRSTARADPRIAKLDPTDAAFRVAGLGSLGLPRFIVLARTLDDSRTCGLLDVKEARPSVAAAQSPFRQPRWKSEAERIVSVQRRVQAASPAFLTTAESRDNAYVIKALQPTEDRLDVASLAKRRSTFKQAIETMAQVTAWGHVRSAARSGSATVDELMRFAKRRGWTGPIERFARRYGTQVEVDADSFATAWKTDSIPLLPDVVWNAMHAE